LPVPVPLATYAAGYLVQRTIIMATLFSLLAMLCYLHGSLRHKTLWLWLCVPLYYLAVFSKEHAIMLPAVLLVLTVLLYKDWWEQLRKRFAIFAALTAIAIFVLLARKGLLGSVYEVNAPYLLMGLDSEFAYPLSILTQSWLFFKYALLWFLPYSAWLSIDMREYFAQSLFSPYLIALLSFFVWGGVGLWLLLKRGRIGLFGFALLFPWLMFFTEFSTVRIQEVFVLYRSYLWAAGACCLLPAVFYKVNVRMASFFLTAIAIGFFTISLDRLATFSHPLLLWDDAIKLVEGRIDVPGANRIYYNRGTELTKLGRNELAIADFKQSITLAPGYADVYGNMGVAYSNDRNWEYAIQSFDTAIGIVRQKHDPTNPRFIYGRALALEKMGDIEKARDDYVISCRLVRMGCDKLGKVLSLEDLK